MRMASVHVVQPAPRRERAALMRPVNQSRSLSVTALDIRALKIPSHQERAILVLDNAVREEGSPIQQVGDAGGLVPERLEREHRSDHPVQQGERHHGCRDVEPP